ncbi:MAG: hypothetical protein H0T59_03755 [Chloroflexi bacterium]|nr:hypothetical protein [Chloroflexota bacterium]
MPELQALARPDRRGPLLVALGALAILVFAVVTSQGRPTDRFAAASGSPGSSESVAGTGSLGPAVVATPVPDSQPLETPTPTPGPAARDPTVTPKPSFESIQVTAGQKRLARDLPAPIRLTAIFGRGWRRAGPSMFVKPNAVGSVGLSIGAWRIEHVNLYPCRWSEEAYTDTQFDATPEGLANALASWWGQDRNLAPLNTNSKIAPIASQPQPFLFHGHPSWYVEVLVPTTLDLTECDGDQLVLWQSTNGDARYALGSGELLQLWVIEIDGKLVVIGAGSSLIAPSEERAELQEVIDSLVIKP